jgi:hypothetical protein
MSSKVPLTLKDKGEGRQSPLVGWVLLGATELLKHNDAVTEVFEMPDQYRLTKVMVEVVTAFNAGASLNVGYENDPDAFLTIDLTVKGFSKGAYVDMGRLGTIDGDPIVIVPSGIDGSSGLLTITAKYNVEGRTHCTQG